MSDNPDMARVELALEKSVGLVYERLEPMRVNIGGAVVRMRRAEIFEERIKLKE